MPQFSILMANYDNAAFIDEAIRSVLNQTFSDWELVVIDDASRDDSVERIGKYLNDARIRLYKNMQNQGYTKTLIFGLTKVSCDIVGLLDSDDALTVNAVEKAHAIHTTNAEVGLVLSQVIYCNAQLTSLEMTSTKPEHRNVPLVWMTGPNAFRSFKMGAYRKTAGLDARFKHAEDWDLIFKLEEVAPTLRIDEPLYRYRIIDTSASNAPHTYLVGIRSSAHALYCAYRRRGRACFDLPQPVLLARLAAAVRHSALLNEPGQAVVFAFRALRVAPFQRSSWRALKQSIQSALRLLATRRPALNSSGVPNLGPEAGKGRMLRSFAVSSLQSNTGNIEPDYVVCIPLVHKKGHCIYGGDYLIAEEGTYRAVFELEIIPYSFAVSPLVILDVYENLSEKAVLAHGVIDVIDLKNQPQTFYLDFNAKLGFRVEFRVFWREQSFLKAHGVILRRREAGSVPEHPSTP